MESFQKLDGYATYIADDLLLRRAIEIERELAVRRSVRHFASTDVPRDVIASCLRSAGSAPSGANHQPWHFVAIHQASTKQRIREAAEIEEREFYQRRAPQEWLEELRPLGTNWEKPFLETAPWLIAVFAETHDEAAQKKHYYVNESVGIATGLLISSLHRCGLATLTHTPSPMHFLNKILHRPKNERPFLLLVVGYPTDDCRVPILKKKSLQEFTSFVE